ncbi:DUF2147 domain-containing protein [Pandoraea apista]|uniref:DUF2147 domain-containing protein n=1 Tax=Pandoraea apista TaxID=93218 RepID=A0A0B5FKJ0_9BURK|nr:DUF2147 domain-containing protein [Pandoraea apista]AJF00244.1 hypothetical protein SG18_22455 [Pandoraea apista]AKH74409.1 hypothetical protein XM39_22635 [Pandoraea apista]AKI62959.1 hypothetical protein AA956_15960 [Pandoraea apista]ALS64626.2 hypothetical protein AT395_06175 [Pandoraea apista]OXS88820.1 hypothetical protein B7H01_24310 [Pandoraea apista]
MLNMTLWQRLCVAIALSANALFAMADNGMSTPVGVWRIVDETGDPKALITISEKDGEYVGALTKSLGRSDALERRCNDCTDWRKGRKLQGLEIIRGLRKAPDSDEYTGGKILDPDSGSEYGCKMRVVDGGRKLEVRGYFGISLLGRTQTWIREQ